MTARRECPGTRRIRAGRRLPRRWLLRGYRPSRSAAAPAGRARTGRGRATRLLLAAALALLSAGCGGTPLYGPPEPGQPSPTAPASLSLQLFKQAETGPFARAFQADAATFNRDSRDRQLPPSVLGEDAYQVSADIAAWAQAMRRAPVPPEYERAKAGLLHGLALLQRGYQHIGNGLLYGDPAQLRQGRADVRAGSRIIGGPAAAESV